MLLHKVESKFCTSCTQSMARCMASESGHSLLEFALTLPALLILVTGILNFGAVMYQNMSLSEATQVATRQLVVARGQTTDPCATITSAVVNSTTNMDDSKLIYSLILNGTTYNGTTCAAASTNMVIGAPMQVKVTYPFSLILYNKPISSSFNLIAQVQDKVQ